MSNIVQTGPIHCCNVNSIQLAKAFRDRARLHAVSVLKRDGASDEQRKQLQRRSQKPAVLHL